MSIINNYLTKNPCYASGRVIAVKGLMLHSIGCPQPDPMVFVRNWNRADYKNACVHGFIGERDTHITLPCMETKGKAMRGWHCASGPKGSGNNTHLGFEMCEPATIQYTGGATFKCTDRAKAVAYVKKTTANAVELFAKLCLFHGLNPLADGVIISHAEGHRRGIASNHGDPDHLWRQLGMNYSMDSFRRDVAEAMKEDDDMDQAKFNEFFRNMRADLQDNDCGEWSKAARQWAIENSIIAGGGPGPDGKPNYMWADLLTREQAVMLLYRFAQFMGKA